MSGGGEARMFEAVVSSRERERGGNGWLSLPVSSALHVAVLGSLAALSYLTIGSIREPLADIVFIGLPPAPRPMAAPPPPRGSKAISQPVAKKRVAAERLPEMLQPQSVPDEFVPPEAPAEPGNESVAPAGEPDGDDGGLLGGLRGGQRGGKAGGDINGSLDGVRHGLADGSGADEPSRIFGDIRPPELIFKLTPEFPEIARRSRVEGKVILEIVVNRRGEVDQVTVLRSHALFDEAAIAAVR